MLQKTIKNEVSFSGKGFMLDRMTSVTLIPREENTGIIFRRTDVENDCAICAEPQNLRYSPNCTTLEKNDVKVIVVEHLMSACWALGISNLEVRIDSPELPTFDGSAMPYVEYLQSAGLVEQQAPVTEISLRSPIVVKENEDKCLIASPAESFRVSYILKYPEYPNVETQFTTFDGDREKALTEILPARTFIPEEEARKLLEQQIITGTDESMGVVIRAGDIPQLRLPDEFARHKVLDILGDLYILGKGVKAHFLGVMSGHKLNAKMVQAISARYL